MVARNYSAVTSEDALKALVDKLMAEEKTVGFDIETGYHGPDRKKGSVYIDWEQQFPAGFSITNSSTSWARYVPTAHEFSRMENAWEIVKPALETLPIIAHNCFVGETEFLVRDKGPQRLDEFAGTTQQVWNGSKWVSAEIRSFGYAPVREVVLAPANRSRSKVRHVFRATSNHRWELRSGRVVTTAELSEVPKSDVVAASWTESEYLESEAFVHGLIYADGALSSRQSKHLRHYHHQIRLCGAKAEYVGLFQRHTYPKSSNGDPVALHTSPVNMKQLPVDPTDQYVRDFIEGWTQFDGTERRGGTRTLNTVREEDVLWLEKHASRAGWLVTGRSEHSLSTQFSSSDTVHFVHLSRDPDMGWRIVSVSEEAEALEEVFCATVLEGAERFTLVGGVLTGNSKFEKRNLRALDRKGLGPRIEVNIVGDTMLQSYVVSKFMKHNLKGLVLDALGHQMAEIESLFPGLPKNKLDGLRFNILDINDPEVVSYACEDALWCLALNDYFMPLIEASSAHQFMYQLEMENMELLCDMEDAGHATDWDAMADQHQYAEPFVEQMKKAARDGLSAMAGTDLSELNLNSSPQMRKVLYGDLGLKTTRLTKKGEPSTDATALEGLSREFPPVKKVLEVREVENLKNRLKKWTEDYSITHDSRVHANFNQVVVASGRFSANDPAIQQLPKEWRWTTLMKTGLDIWEEEKSNHWQEIIDHPDTVAGKHYWGGNFRNFLCAAPSTYLLFFDYSQVELRALAGLSQEPYLIKAFNDKVDIHKATAAMMLGKAIHEVTKKDRGRGKTINFGIVYGMGAKLLAEQLAISVHEAQDLLDKYMSAFSKVSGWMAEQKAFGKTYGYVNTHFGRKITLWDLQSDNFAIQGKGERLCVNAPVQGTAADIMKVSMIRCKRALIQRGWWMTKVRMINNVHDALTFEADNDIDPGELRELLRPCVSWEVPGFPELAVDWEIGQNWGEAEAWKDEDDACFVDGFWQVVKAKKPEPVEEPAPQIPENDGSEDFTLICAAKPPSSGPLLELVELLREHPGKGVVTLRFPEGEVPVPKHPTAILKNHEAVQQMIRLMGGQGAVTVEPKFAQSIDIAAVFAEKMESI